MRERDKEREARDRESESERQSAEAKKRKKKTFFWAPLPISCPYISIYFPWHVDEMAV